MKIQTNEDITDIFTPEGIKKLKKGQILFFDDGAKKTQLKITKIANNRVFAKKVITYGIDEVTIGTGKNRKTIEEYYERTKR